MNWYVVKVDTQDGLRIGISQEPADGEVLAEIVGDNTKLASEEAQSFVQELGIPMFDNNVDILM